jgi:hypothetical protein
MTDTILQAITQHIQERYPHLFAIQVEVENNPVMTQYTRFESTGPTLPKPHCYLYHNNGILFVYNEYFQTTEIELANPESTDQIHEIIEKILSCDKINSTPSPPQKNGNPSVNSKATPSGTAPNAAKK